MLEKRRVIMSCRIVNLTPFILVPMHSYFFSGSFEAGGVEPRLTYAFSNTTFNLSDGPATGVSGGLSMSALLPRGAVIDFALGFTDPLFGKTKCGAAFSIDPKAGYNQATVEEETIVATDRATARLIRQVFGWPVRFSIHSAGSRRCEWEIKLEPKDAAKMAENGDVKRVDGRK